jgi:hypothetical protein
MGSELIGEVGVVSARRASDAFLSESCSISVATVRLGRIPAMPTRFGSEGETLRSLNLWLRCSLRFNGTKHASPLGDGTTMRDSRLFRSLRLSKRRGRRKAALCTALDLISGSEHFLLRSVRHLQTPSPQRSARVRFLVGCP